MSGESVLPASEVLAERLRIAELVGQVSRHFIDLPASRIQEGIEGALKSVVGAMGMQHGFVAEFSADHASFQITHRYSRAPRDWVFPLDQVTPSSALPWLTARIFDRESIIALPENPLPAEAAAERLAFERVPMAWRAFFPLDAGGSVLGCVVFGGDGEWRSENEEGLRVLSQIFASALDRKRADDELQQRYRQAELIGDVSRRFIGLPAAELGAGIDETLERIAKLYGFLRANVYEIADDRTTFAITHRYLAPGIIPLVPLQTPRPLQLYGFVFERLEDGEPIVLSSDALPENAVGEREALKREEERMALVLPLIIGGAVLGAVAFESRERLSPALIASLRVVGELFSSALERERSDEALGERLRFEEALSQISSQLVRDRGQLLDRAVLDALGTVGAALDFDRVSVFELTEQGRFFSLSNEWCAEGIESFAPSLSGLPIDEFGFPMTELREGRAVVFGLADIPPGAKNAHRVLERDGTRLFATVPLVVGGEVLGCIGFHRIRSSRRLSEHQLRRLRLVGEMVADAMGRRSAEGSLLRSEARLAKVMASALDGFAMLNEAGVILEWTPQAESILGFPRGEMVGGSLWDIVTSGTPGTPELPRDLYELSHRAPGGRLDLLGRHRDGREIPIELSISAIDEGTSPRYALFIRDITERKRAEQVRQQAFQEIARLKVQIEGERDYLREEIRSDHQVGEFIGRSRALRNVLDLIESVASTSATVLIRGESGVGKELVARAIHARSSRGDGPLVKVNCASIPKDLFESEFFGHVRGAFTGAHKDRAGRFELADKGTLFLDEVGEIPLSLQSKLLRVLQESEFERVGDDRTRRVDVRVVAATNRDLEAETVSGTFRKDLYYRLSVFPVEVPPLRERREDIIPLAEHFLRLQGRELGRAGLALDDEQRQFLEAYGWPGNVRELMHVIARAVILSVKPPLRLEAALQPAASSPAPAPGRLLMDADLRSLERENIITALEQTSWRVSGAGGAAELLGINASTLRDRMRSFDIRRASSE